MSSFGLIYTAWYSAAVSLTILRFLIIASAPRLFVQGTRKHHLLKRIKLPQARLLAALATQGLYESPGQAGWKEAALSLWLQCLN